MYISLFFLFIISYLVGQTLYGERGFIPHWYQGDIESTKLTSLLITYKGMFGTEGDGERVKRDVYGM